MRFFGRHLVALCVTYRDKESADTSLRYTAYSCTLLQIDEYYFLLTAGHILGDLNQALKSDTIEVLQAVLRDNPNSGSVHDMPIPFDLKNALMAFIDEDGLDFGVIILHPYYVRLLDANGMVAISEENWARQHTVRFDAHFMLGFPEELTSTHVNTIDEGSITPTMFPVERLDEPPGDLPPKPYSRFVGKLPANFSLASVVGMSGGPILGFNLTPPMRYWVVALQSTWLRDRRLVFGCPLPLLAPLLTEALRNAHTISDIQAEKLATQQRPDPAERGEAGSDMGETPAAHRIREILSKAKELAAEYYQLTGKPLGITGEVAEYVAAEVLNLELAPPRTKGYDAIRKTDYGDIRIQIKGRAFGEHSKRSQRLGTIKKGAPCDKVLLVLLDIGTLEPREMWEAPMATVEERLALPGSKARERGSLGVSEFKRLADRIWPQSKGGE